MEKRLINILWCLIRGCLGQVDATTTIERVKMLFQDKEGVPPDWQDLFLGGERLEDDATVGFLGIQDGTTMTLSQRIRGV
jgi:hypothetical protein